MSKHTPGPWIALNDNNPDYIDIDGNGTRICSICLDISGIDFEGGDDTPENEVAERKSNANLIAASPDLYDAVQAGIKMRRLQNHYFRNRNSENLIASKQAEKEFDELAASALAEANGES